MDRWTEVSSFQHIGGCKGRQSVGLPGQARRVRGPAAWGPQTVSLRPGKEEKGPAKGRRGVGRAAVQPLEGSFIGSDS